MFIKEKLENTTVTPKLSHMRAIKGKLVKIFKIENLVSQLYWPHFRFLSCTSHVSSLIIISCSWLSESLDVEISIIAESSIRQWC